MFIMSNQNIVIQKMSNQHDDDYYCEQPTLKFFSKSEMCSRGPGDTGRILPLVPYLIRYPLGTYFGPLWNLILGFSGTLF